jgi:hypothetical protein
MLTGGSQTIAISSDIKTAFEARKARSSFARLMRKRDQDPKPIRGGDYIRFNRERDKARNGPERVLKVNQNKVTFGYKGAITSATRSNVRKVDSPFKIPPDSEEIEKERNLEPIIHQSEGHRATTDKQHMKPDAASTDNVFTGYLILKTKMWRSMIKNQLTKVVRLI